jgi:hypothetical protein
MKRRKRRAPAAVTEAFTNTWQGPGTLHPRDLYYSFYVAEQPSFSFAAPALLCAAPGSKKRPLVAVWMWRFCCVGIASRRDGAFYDLVDSSPN